MSWMRLEVSFRDHSKLRHVSRTLQLPMVSVRGMLVSLYARVLLECPDGNLANWTPDDIADACDAHDLNVDKEELLGVLVDARLLDKADGSFSVHDWMEYAHAYREAARKRKARALKAKENQEASNSKRTRRRSASKVSRTVQDTAVPPAEMSHSSTAFCPPDGQDRQDGQDRRDKTDGHDETIILAPSFAVANSKPHEQTSEPLRLEIVEVDDQAGVAVPDFPCVGQGAKTWDLSQKLFDELVEAFPGVDIEQEAMAARQWCRAQRDKGKGGKCKTARGMPAFISQWMSKAQNRAVKGSESVNPYSPAAKAARFRSAAHAWVEARERKENEIKTDISGERSE